jgi:hypothetical protein
LKFSLCRGEAGGTYAPAPCAQAGRNPTFIPAAAAAAAPKKLRLDHPLRIT